MRSRCNRASFACWNISCATPARSSRARCSSTMSGIIISIRAPMWWNRISAGCGPKSTKASPQSSFTRFVAQDIAFVRRNKLFHAPSFRLALLYAGLLTVSVLLLFGLTYWLASDYATQDEVNEIAVEGESIQDEARAQGQAQLPAIIDNHLRLRRDVRAVYLLQDEAGHKIGGNIDAVTPFVGPTILDLVLDGQMRQVRAYGYRLDDGKYLVVGQDTATLRQMRALIVRAFSIGFVVTVLMAILGSG